MKFNYKYFLGIVTLLGIACADVKDAKENAPLFPQGKKNTSTNFTGDVWVASLVTADSLNGSTVGNVTFAAGARSNWHSHPAGQIILATEGVGYYQEKGKVKQILKKGDIIKCAPNVSHWHGASKDSKFVQLAVSNSDKGPAVWLEPVTDDVYLAE